jgi:hypothetical protein
VPVETGNVVIEYMSGWLHKSPSSEKSGASQAAHAPSAKQGKPPLTDNVAEQMRAG